MKNKDKADFRSLISALKQQGFSSAAMVPESEISRFCIKNSGFAKESTILMVFFPYYIPPEEKQGQPGLIAPFALSNYYKAIIIKLKTAVREAGLPFSGLSKRQIRLFANSPLPEKRLAKEAGIGFQGRNTLLISPPFGSCGLLGGMIIPLLPLDFPSPTQRSSWNCGRCRLCEEACPGGALKGGRLERRRCLQHWSTAEAPIPDDLKEIWGCRIYGCTLCQDICPRNKGIPEGLRVSQGELVPEPDLEFYLENREDFIKSYLKGSSLGLSWIKEECLVRNALVSCGWAGRTDLLPLVEKHKSSPNPIIRDAALWAWKKLKGRV